MPPLSGIRVIDFGHHVAGPAAAMLLHQQGASVIRIERPAALRPTVPAHDAWNREKETRVLDLGDPRDRDAAFRLAAEADVVIENFRPGVMERLGCGASALSAVNPGLIYCSIPGFAANDPRACVPAWEGIVHAASGLYHVIGTGSQPAYTTLPLASLYGAVHAALNIAVALLRRDRTGQGAHVEVPLFCAMLSGAVSFRVRTPRGRLGHPATYSASLGSHAAFDAAYRCSDGRYLYVLAGDHSKFANILVSALGLRADPALDLIERDPWLGPDDRNINDPFFLSPEVNERLRASLCDVFASRTAEEWERELLHAGVPAAVCRTTSEWFETGTVPCGPLVDVSATEVPAATTLGQRREPARRGPPDMGPLTGVRVLDLSTVVAGPVSARTLGEFGADVIKIDSPRPNHNPVFTCALGIDVNRGKRSLLCDLKDPDGREVWHRLLTTADVVIDNLSETASLDIRRECEGRGLVHARISAFGFDGIWAGRKGYDPVVQAATGIQSRFGGTASPRVHGSATTLDYLTGYAAAFGIVLALFQRRRASRPGVDAPVVDHVVRTSLAHAAALVQSDLVGDAGPEVVRDDRQRRWGATAFDRIYRCRDGWMYVACPGNNAEVLSHLLPFDDLRGTTTIDIEERLEKLFASGDIRVWSEQLHAVGIAAHRVMSVSSIRRESLRRQDALFQTMSYPDLGPVDILSTGRFISGVPRPREQRAPKLGSHTFEILSELEVPASIVSRLLAKHVIADSLGHEYVP